MIAKRYLALLTGVAMATSTVVAPNAGAQDTQDTETVAVDTLDNAPVETNDPDTAATETGTELDGDDTPADATAEITNEPAAEAVVAEGIYGDLIINFSNTFSIDAPGNSADVSFYVTDARGTHKSAGAWVVTAKNNTLTVIPPTTAREGDTVHIVVTQKGTGNLIANATLKAAVDGPDTKFAGAAGIEPGGTSSVPGPVPEDAVYVIEVYGQDGKAKSNSGWVASRGSAFDATDLTLTAPENVRKGDYAVVTVTDSNGNFHGEGRFTVQSDGEIDLGFDIGGDIQPGIPMTWDVDVDSAETLNYYVENAEGDRISEDDWEVSLVDGALTITAPGYAREGDRLILVAKNGDEIVGTANVKVVVNGLLMDLKGDIVSGGTTAWPTRIDTDKIDEYDVDYVITDDQGRDKSPAGWNVEFRDGEIFVTVPETAAENDRIIVTVREGERIIGKADLRVVTAALLFDISGDILPGEVQVYDERVFDVDSTTSAFAVYDAEGNEKSREGWDFEITADSLIVTAAPDAEEGDFIVFSARNAEGRLIGKGHLKVIAKAEEDHHLAYNINDLILPGVEFISDDIDLPNHQPEFTVYRDGEEISSEGWKVSFVDGALRVTAPESAREGDIVEIVSTDEDGKTVGKARLKVVVDGAGDGSAVAPWWAALLPILGIAGVIALLAGGSSLSSGSSLPGSSADSDSDSADDAGAGAGEGSGPAAGQGEGAQGGEGADQTGTAPATGPVAAQDVKAAAQAQAANAPAAAQGATTQQQPVAQAAEKQGFLANTGVQGTLMALVVGLLAAAAGVFLLASRRRNS